MILDCRQTRRLWQHLMLLIVLCLFSCGDSASHEGPKSNTLNVTVAPVLSRTVEKHDLEMGLAGEIFAQQAMRKAKAIEAALIPIAKKLRANSAIDALESIFVKESLALADLDPEIIRQHVTTQKLSFGETTDSFLSILLKGSDSSRRLILVTGALSRRTMSGVGSTAMEISAALEVMRVLIQRRVVGRTEPLPFDLEYIHLAQAPADLGFLSQAVPKETLILGVLCLEDITPEKIGSSNLVIEVVPKKESTLVSALSGTMKQYAGG